ncbi:DciA family protein [Streptomyces sp. bgisy126]|uniref:DciA family protein n=1 Tax=unclassified Streptomyces TaxID=2593676 RepID=UPI003EB82078
MRPDEPPGRVDMAAAALRAAREDVRFRRPQSRRSQIAVPAPRWRRNAVLVPLGQVLRDFVERHDAALAVVRALWHERVGPDLAKHVVVAAYDATDGVLSVRADSVAWATQTRLLGSRLVGVLHDVFVQAGVGPVRTMRITGPQLTPVPVADVETEASRGEASRPLPRQMPWVPRAFTPRFAPVVDQAVDDAVSRQAVQAERKSRDRLDRQRARTASTRERVEASDSVWEAALRRARTKKAGAPSPPTGP